jgi:Zn-dependent peptidase ImmA (M78 family)
MEAALDPIVIRHGDRARFAAEVTFLPDEEPDTRGEDAVAWGELSLWVGARNLCAHTLFGEQRIGVRWHLLGVLEWLAGSFDELLHETRLPVSSTGIDAAQTMERTRQHLSVDDLEELELWQSWWARHNLRAGADGGLLPNLYVRRRGGRIEVSWDSTRLDFPPEGLTFEHPAGHDLLEPLEAGHVLFAWLDEASAVLSERADAGARVAALRRRVAELRDVSRTERRLALAAGFAASDAGLVDEWRELQDLGYGTAAARRAAFDAPHDELVVSGSCAAQLMWGTLSPTLDAADRRRIVAMLLQVYAPASESADLARLVRGQSLASDLSQAWAQGYELAEQLHNQLAVDTEEPVDVEAILVRLGVDLRVIDLTDDGIRGLTVASPEHRPTITVNRRFKHGHGPDVRRFTLAHELCHLLLDRDQGRDVALASSEDWAPVDVERRANAFAAMFLMPRAAVQGAVARATHAPETLPGAAFVARRLQVPVQTAIHHLKNLDYVDTNTHDELLERLAYERALERHKP